MVDRGQQAAPLGIPTFASDTPLLQFGDPMIAKQIGATYGTSFFGSAKLSLPIESACGRTFLDARVHGVRLSKAEIDAACSGEGANVYAYFGYVDDALRAWESADAYSRQYLFLPHNRLMRADPRSIELAARFGLVDYWLDTDQWPDFCKEEKLSYDCKKQRLQHARMHRIRQRAQRHSCAPRSPPVALICSVW